MKCVINEYFVVNHTFFALEVGLKFAKNENELEGSHVCREPLRQGRQFWERLQPCTIHIFEVYVNKGKVVLRIGLTLTGAK